MKHILTIAFCFALLFSSNAQNQKHRSLDSLRKKEVKHNDKTEKDSKEKKEHLDKKSSKEKHPKEEREIKKET